MTHFEIFHGHKLSQIEDSRILRNFHRFGQNPQNPQNPQKFLSAKLVCLKYVSLNFFKDVKNLFLLPCFSFEVKVLLAKFFSKSLSMFFTFWPYVFIYLVLFSWHHFYNILLHLSSTFCYVGQWKIWMCFG